MEQRQARASAVHFSNSKYFSLAEGVEFKAGKGKVYSLHRARSVIKDLKAKPRALAFSTGQWGNKEGF